MTYHEQKYFFHVDFDAFFASCHVAREPALKGLPLIVGGDPIRGRGVVSTCSYAAREYGIRSAMPVSQAVVLCPHAIFIKSDFELYSSISRVIMTYLEKMVKNSLDVPGKFQKAGMDEVYMDLTDRIIANGLDPQKMATDIKEKVKEMTGITCSIGIAPTKTCAKIASDENKPDGITYVKPGEVTKFLAPLPVTRIPGIGKKTGERFKRWGIKTIGQLARFSPEHLSEHMKYFWEVANGLHEGEVHEERGERKSISKERTFFDGMEAVEETYRYVERLVEELQGEMVEKGFSCRTVTVKIRTMDYKTRTRSVSLPEPVTDYGMLAALAREILMQWVMGEEYMRREKPVFRLLGVKLSNFSKEKPVAVPLVKWF
ncbi:MAG: DNA polymerase IV [Candidatus Hodarchaeales archaeon]|jgi:DNA polymerase IV (DinB-like DNA polymerase)